MDNRQKETVEININGTEAKKELEQLKKRAEAFREAMTKAAKEKGIDSEPFKKAERELKKTETQIRKMQQSMVDVNHVLTHLDTATPKELRRVMKEINKQLNSGNIARGSKEWNQYQEQLRKVRQEMALINSESKGAMTWGEKLSSNFSKWGGKLAGAAASIAGLYYTISNFGSKAEAKEESQANLKALTGLDDESIAWLTQQAEKISTTMDETGLRVRKSSQEILEAYMLVGSNKPELLADKEALNAVTVEAMRLSAAANMDLNSAVNAVTTSLNQWGASANETSRYVNVLAAGSKAGAADVEQQAAAVLRAGVAANMAGLQFEEFIGMVETLAEAGIKGETAGTGLKTFLLKLETGADETKPSVVGLQTALENLSAHADDTAWLKKTFGDEAINIASTLVRLRGRVLDYSKAVTDTNVAEEQAAIVSDTLAAKKAQLSNQLNELGIQLMDTINPAIVSVTGEIVNWINALVTLAQWFNRHRTTLAMLVVSITAYTVALKAHAIAQALANFWNNQLITSFKKLKAAMASNPWGLLAIAISTAVGYLIDFVSEMKEATDLEKRQLDMSRKISDEYARETNQAKILRERLRDENTSRDEKLKIIKKLQDLIPDYTADLDEEGRLIRENKKAIDDYNQSVEDRIKLRVYEDELEDVLSQKEQAQDALDEKRAKKAQLDNNGSRAWLQRWWEDITEGDIEAQQKKVDDLTATYDKLMSKIVELQNKGVTTTPTVEDDGGGGGGGGGGKPPKDQTAAILQRLDTQMAAEKAAQSQLLANKKISQEQYDQWVYNAELKLIEDKQKLYKKDSQEWNRLEAEKQGKIAKWNENNTKDQKKALEASLKELDAKKAQQKISAEETLKAGILNGANKEVSEIEYQQKVFEIEQSILDEKMKLYDKDSQEYKALLLEKEEAAKSNALRVQAVAANMLGKYITYNKNSFQKDYELAQQMHDKKILLDENYIMLKSSIAQKEAAQWLKSYAEDVNNYRSTLNDKKAALQQDLADGKITLAGYNAAIQQLSLEGIDLMKERTTQALQQLSSLIGSIGNLVSASYDQQIAEVEARYDAEISAAEKAGRSTTQLEKEKDAEVTKLKKEQAEKQAAIDIAQALLNTAMSISQTLAAYGTTPWGIAMAAIAATMGAIQVAAIKKQAEAKIAGYYDGGYTNGTRYHREAGVVHEGEFVGNHESVNNPAIRNIYDYIDQAQRNNRVGSITSDDLAMVAAHRAGYYKGGYVGSPSISVSPAPVTVQRDDNYERLAAAIEGLVNNGVIAHTYYQGPGGIKEAKEKYDKLYNNAHR